LRDTKAFLAVMNVVVRKKKVIDGYDGDTALRCAVEDCGDRAALRGHQ
jgi:hypothetical protein